jgi:hypothetical protein
LGLKRKNIEDDCAFNLGQSEIYLIQSQTNPKSYEDATDKNE